jgi:uncharacterized Zn finger protein (UPF0148 family)
VAWFKVDDGFHASRKLLKIGKRSRFAAVGLWTVAGSWAADQLTDGNVPDYMLTEWGAPPAAPASLVDAGLWERTHDGYLFCNWHEYQPSKQDVDAERAASRERMRELRAKRKGKKPLEQAEEGDAFGRTDPNSSESVRNPDPTRPDPVPTQPNIEEADASSSPRKRASRIREDFDVTPEMRLWASTKAPNTDLGLETEKFINFWVAKSGKDATKLDWVATWRNWILNARTSQPARDPSVVRMDHSARARAKEADMLARFQSSRDQTFLEIEG